MIKVELIGETELRIKLDSAKREIPRGVTAGIKAALINLSSYIKANKLSGQAARNITGNLRRSVFWRMDSALSGSVAIGREAPYGRFVNDGTRPHQIVAKNAGALAFSIGGEV